MYFDSLKLRGKMIDNLFITLSLTVIFAVVVSGLMKLLKQPLIIGYIFTGILAGPYFFNLFQADDMFKTLSQIGVAFLLFMVGLNLNPKIIKEVGKISLITGIGQVLFTAIIGFLISQLLGFTLIVSLYVSIALAFSSTIIIMKLLSDKGDINSLYGKISIGFLIVQDLIAVFALMVVSSLSRGGNLSSIFGITLLKGFLAVALVLAFGIYILPFITRKIAKSQEFLFLFSVGWALAISSLFFVLDFSLEIGALLAGIALSMSPYSIEISSKMKPLRDFFLIIFFILIGSQIIFSHVQQNLLGIIIFSLFILIGNPLIVMILMGVSGYTKKNSFLAGLTVAQISEFSIILVALGVGVGHLTNEVLSLVTTVGLITITGSTYMIIYADTIYSKISKYLSIFEKKEIKKERKIKKSYDTILFGYNRTGFNILRSLKRIKQKYLVVDYNPDTVEALKKLRIPVLYGDGSDQDLLDELPLDKIKFAISTFEDRDTNHLLIKSIRLVNPDAVIIARADQVKDALDLYQNGADYVLTPHLLGGEHIASMIDATGNNYKEEKDKHVKLLRKMMKRRHDYSGFKG